MYFLNFLSINSILLFSIFLPFVCSLLIFIFRKQLYIKEVLSTLCSILLLCLTSKIYLLLQHNEGIDVILYSISPTLHISFKTESIGVIFSVLVSFLWVATNIYSISYMLANDKYKAKQGIFFLCFASSIGCTICIAFSGDLLTLFIFYELLTIISYFLVTYNADHNSQIAGRYYLGGLLSTSIMLFLPALMMTYIINGTLDFTLGGVFNNNNSSTIFTIIFIAFCFGIGKMAIMPFHFWLPKAMVAPTPVSALLHAVAVVKSGLYTIIKIIVYILGINNIKQLSEFHYLSNHFLMYIAGFTIIVSSLLAIKQNNLKKVLAYSTISQLSYITVTISLFTVEAIKASIMQLIAHSLAKITLFFATGIIYTASGKKNLDELYGIGRLMPITMIAFTIGVLGIVGLPPTMGFWSKFFIIYTSINENNFFIPVVLIISTLLSIMYLFPIIHSSFFEKQHLVCKKISIFMMIPLIVTSIINVIFFFMFDRIFDIINLSIF